MNWDFKATPEALQQLKALAEASPSPQQMRIAVRGAGCSGLQYRFLLEGQSTTQEEGESVAPWSPPQLPVVFDAITRQYLEGALLHHHRSFQSSAFQILQPRLSSSCRCGRSFGGIQGAGEAGQRS